MRISHHRRQNMRGNRRGGSGGPAAPAITPLISGFSSSAYLASATGANSDADLGTGKTLIVVLAPTTVYQGDRVIAGYGDATHGWKLWELGDGSIALQYMPSTTKRVIGVANRAPGRPLRIAVKHVAADGNPYCSIDGGFATIASSPGSYTAGGASSAFYVGRDWTSTAFNLVDAGVSALALYGSELSDADMAAETGRLTAWDIAEAGAAIGFNALTDFDPESATVVTGGSAPLTLNVNGTPTKSAVPSGYSKTSLVGRTWEDSGTPTTAASGLYDIPSTFASLVIETDSDQLLVEAWNSGGSAGLNFPQWGYRINGSPIIPVPWQGGVQAMPRITALELGDAGVTKTIELVSGSQSTTGVVGVELQGVFLSNAWVPSGRTLDFVTAPHLGRVVFEAFGVRSLNYDYTIDATLVTLATRLVAEANAGGGSLVVYGDSIAVGGNSDRPITQSAWNQVRTQLRARGTAERGVWIEIGTNDFNVWAGGRADFKAALKVLINAIKALDGTLPIYVQTLFPRIAPASVTNDLGETLAQWRTAQTEAASETSVTAVDGTALVTSAGLGSDGLHQTVDGQLTTAKSTTVTLSIPWTVIDLPSINYSRSGEMHARIGAPTTGDVLTSKPFLRAVAANVPAFPAFGDAGGRMYQAHRAQTNGLAQSRDNTAVGWTAGSGATYTSNATPSPDGTQNGQRVAVTSGGYSSYQAFAVAADAVGTEWARSLGAGPEVACLGLEGGTPALGDADYRNALGPTWTRLSASYNAPGAHYHLAQDGRDTSGITGAVAGARDAVVDLRGVYAGKYPPLFDIATTSSASTGEEHGEVPLGLPLFQRDSGTLTLSNVRTAFAAADLADGDKRWLFTLGGANNGLCIEKAAGVVTVNAYEGGSVVASSGAITPVREALLGAIVVDFDAGTISVAGIAGSAGAIDWTAAPDGVGFGCVYGTTGSALDGCLPLRITGT